MVPKSAGLAGLILATLAAGPDTSSLIARLGSAKYAEREAAAAAIQKLGTSALPALKAARSDVDPEVKNRAEVLLDTIERSLLTRAATVHFEAGRHTLAEVAEKLGEAQGLTIATPQQKANAAGIPREMDLPAAQDMSLWQTLDRLGLTLQHDNDQFSTRGGSSRGMIAQLGPAATGRPQAHDHGPFRLTVGIPYFRAPDPRSFRAAEVIVPVEVAAEPRLSVRLAGPVRVNEVVDDTGRSLTNGAITETDPSNPERLVSNLPIKVRLQAAGRSALLKVLRGTASVEVEARKFEPVVMPISNQAQADRRPVVCGNTSVQVNGLTTNPFGFQGSFTVDMTVRGEGWTLNGPGMGGRRGLNGRLWEQVNSDPVWENLEIVDAQGRPFRISNKRVVGLDNDGARLQVILVTRDQPEPPTEVRYYGTIRTTVDVPFEFRDVRLR